MFYCFNFSAYIRSYVRILSETNVNINNELIFLYINQSVNYIGSLAKCKLQSIASKIYMRLSGFIYFVYDPVKFTL